MDKRYQVFVSSTYQDLQEERREVMQALLELDCIPAGMELFPASSEDQWSLIKRVIDDCDYYLLIVGGRYGSTNDSGVSYTEMEYDYAASTGKPMICFLPKHPERIESGKTEQTEAGKKALAAFKEKVQHKMVKFYENPADLGSVVSRSVVKLIKNFPAEGWVKASNAISETELRELADLRKENEALRKQVQSLSTAAPKDATLFQQGEDIISIDIFNVYSLTEQDQLKLASYSIEVTWDDIINKVVPHLIGACSEKNIELQIKELIIEKGAWRKTIRLPRSAASIHIYDVIQRASISEESLRTIIIQLKALGIITVSTPKNSGDNETYWKLTPYGDQLLTNRLALKRAPK